MDLQYLRHIIWPFLSSNSLYKIGQDFMGIQYLSVQYSKTYHLICFHLPYWFLVTRGQSSIIWKQDLIIYKDNNTKQMQHRKVFEMYKYRLISI